MNSKLSNPLKSSTLLIVLVFAVCLTWFTAVSTVNAEETDVSLSDTEISEEEKNKRTELLDQIAALRETIRVQKEELAAQNSVRREEAKTEWQQSREDYRSDLATRRDELMQSLTDATPEEKREALIEFMAVVKAELEAKKTAATENHQERKEMREEKREAWQISQKEFNASIEGLSKEERIFAILERAGSISDKLAEKLDSDVGSDDSTDEVVDKFITVTYPNGGEVLVTNDGKDSDSINVDWIANYEMISPVVSLYHPEEGTIIEVVPEQDLLNKEQMTAVPESKISESGQYKIIICDRGVEESSGKDLCDSSDDFFEVIVN